MNFLRKYWYKLGIILTLVLVIFLLLFGNKLTPLKILLWASFISLLLHQAEEYLYPGYFPGMLNEVLFSSKHPDRYPLNTNTALIVNVFIGWTLYFLAAVFAEKAIWLAISAILVSCGNIIAHTLVFNIKGKTYYNPGMITAILFFLPISIYFFIFITEYHIAHFMDYVIGIPLGILVNYVGVLKLIDILKDPKTSYIFTKKFMYKRS